MAIRDIIRTSETVELPDGQSVVLQVPAMADAVEIRMLLQGVDPDNPAPDLMLRLTVLALQSCLPSEGLTDEEAYQVIAATGGEVGKLARVARDLCGIMDETAGGEAADDLPT